MKHTILPIVVLAFLSLAANAQVKVESNGFTTIGGGTNLTSGQPTLHVKGGFNPWPTTAAKIDLGLDTNMISFRERSLGNLQLELYTGRGIFFTSNYNYSNNPTLPYLKYETDSYVNPNDVFYIYANEFSFNYGTCISLFQSSDGRFKKDVTELPSSLSQLGKLRGVSYRNDFAKHSVYGKDKGLLTDSLGQPIKALSLTSDTSKHIGFIAQELQQVFPELVKADRDGNLAVNYTGLIPVIVEALKEQQTKQDALNKAQSEKIAELQAEVNALRNGTTPAKSKGLEAIDAFLYQNAPNPFSHTTTIRYFLDEETASASIYIFDMQGKFIESHPISGAGEGSVEISASGLQPGMYLYSLLINNQEVDTKRMVITE